MKKTALYLIVFVLAFSLFAVDSARGSSSPPKERVLPIPPLLDDKNKNLNEVEYEITVKKGVTEFFTGAPNITYGYNGPLLGPTLRARRGNKVTIKVTNNLREYTTVHGHGMLLPGEMDGGPHQVVRPDSTWEASFKVTQPASTLWYHPHGIGNTAIQVYGGLAGLFILDDEVSENLDLPKEYGQNDIPLIVQDRRFSPEGYLMYGNFMQDIMQGMTGNVVLVNGVVNPFLQVPAGVIRFRILNGSNARVYDFTLSNGDSFYQIASDGGFLEQPTKMKALRLSPGERAEILIDFSLYPKGTALYLESRGLNIVKFIVGEKTKKSFKIPAHLTSIERIPPSEVKNRRHFDLTGMGHMVAINGKQMNMMRIDEFIPLGTTEIWEVTSRVGMMGMMARMRGSSDIIHNFHAHGIQFQLMERNGKSPSPNELGWKDTFHLNDGERVKIITRFQYPGLFMYHCHILEHEDNGMMGQFKVE